MLDIRQFSLKGLALGLTRAAAARHMVSALRISRSYLRSRCSKARIRQCSIQQEELDLDFSDHFNRAAVHECWGVRPLLDRLSGSFN